ncbi:MAG: 7-cyano-7-deazaguanine synthase QueC [Thermoanaerobaculia bacterium]
MKSAQEAKKAITNVQGRTRIPRAPSGGTREAVLLLSGGLDSATCLALVSRWGWRVHALSFDYGQRHRVELESARDLAARYAVGSHRVVPLTALGDLGGSALTDEEIGVPKSALGKDAIPSTYVPARNTIFLSFAMAMAEVTGASEIVIGANALDYSGYPDCRPEYLRAFERLARLATRSGVEGARLSVRAPLLSLTKAGIVSLALALGLDPGWTTSCYDPSATAQPCGACDSCLLRAKGFAEAGAEDPAAGR